MSDIEIAIAVITFLLIMLLLKAHDIYKSLERLNENMEELIGIKDEVDEDADETDFNWQWGDTFINAKGQRMTLPNECPEGFNITPAQWVAIHQRRSLEDLHRRENG